MPMPDVTHSWGRHAPSSTLGESEQCKAGSWWDGAVPGAIVSWGWGWLGAIEQSGGPKCWGLILMPRVLRLLP